MVAAAPGRVVLRKVKVGSGVESSDANQLFSWNKSPWVF